MVLSPAPQNIHLTPSPQKQRFCGEPALRIADNRALYYYGKSFAGMMAWRLLWAAQYCQLRINTGLSSNPMGCSPSYRAYPAAYRGRDCRRSLLAAYLGINNQRGQKIAHRALHNRISRRGLLRNIAAVKASSESLHSIWNHHICGKGGYQYAGHSSPCHSPSSPASCISSTCFSSQATRSTSECALKTTLATGENEWHGPPLASLLPAGIGFLGLAG